MGVYKGMCSECTYTLRYYKEKIPAEILAKIGNPKKVVHEGMPDVKYDLSQYGIINHE